MTPPRTTPPRMKAIDWLRRESTDVPHEPTLKAMLQIARNSHEDRGFRGSPEAKLLTRILSLRELLAMNAPDSIVTDSKKLVSHALAVLIGVDPVGFELPTYTEPTRLESTSTPRERESVLRRQVRDMQEDGLVDAEGYFIDDPN